MKYLGPQLENEEDSEENEILESEVIEGMSLMEMPSGSWPPNAVAFYGPDTRHICISGEITEDLAVAICSQLQELMVQDQDAPIWVHINTSGGSVVDGLAIYDMMRMVTCPIVTLVNGGALSCGLLLAQGGDIRLATPNSIFFYHQPIMGVQGFEAQEDIETTSGFYLWCKERCDQIIKGRSKISKRAWKKHFEDSRGLYFDTNQAKEFKMIDDIMEHAPAKMKKLQLKDLE